MDYQGKKRSLKVRASGKPQRAAVPVFLLGGGDTCTESTLED